MFYLVCAEAQDDSGFGPFQDIHAEEVAPERDGSLQVGRGQGDLWQFVETVDAGLLQLKRVTARSVDLPLVRVFSGDQAPTIWVRVAPLDGRARLDSQRLEIVAEFVGPDAETDWLNCKVFS